MMAAPFSLDLAEAVDAVQAGRFHRTAAPGQWKVWRETGGCGEGVAKHEIMGGVVSPPATTQPC